MPRPFRDSALDLEKRSFYRSHTRSVYYGLALLAVLIWGSAFLVTAVGALLRPNFSEEVLKNSLFGFNGSDTKVYPWDKFALGKRPLTFDDVRDGTFRAKYKQVQWIHSAESVLNDQGTFLITDSSDKTTYAVKSILDESYHYTLYDNSVFVHGGKTYEIDELKASPDLKSALLKTNTTKGWRYSSTALYWTLDVETQAITPLHDLPDKISATLWAPTSDKVAFIYENNVYVKTLALGTVAQLTHDDSPDIFNGKPDWVYEEEVFASDLVLWWSPQGDKLTFLRFNDTLVPEFTIPYYVQDGHEDYPETVSIKYPKAGYANPTVELVVAHLESPTNVALRTHTANLESHKIKESLITDVLWVSDDYILVKSTNRASDLLEVFLVSTQDDAQAELVRTHTADNAWFEVLARTSFVPRNETLGRHDDGYIDLVEVDGYNHLAYFTPPQNPHPILLTEGRWEVLSGHLDLQRNEVYFTATLESSVQRHFYSVNLLDALRGHSVPEPKKITHGVGWYSGSFSSGSRFVLLNYLGPDVPQQKLLDLHTNEVVKVIETNDELRRSLIEFDLPTQKVHNISLGTDEKTGGKIVANMLEIFPPSFDPARKYPVLFYVYGGPGSQMVTQEYAVGFSQVVASTLNAIVVTVDGRGTGYNNAGEAGAKFKFCVRDQLGHYEPVDQIAAAKIWASYPYVDENRIAIWGWSYGGFLTLKTLETDSENVFSYGVAVAPVTKWKLYDSIYTERYMRTPQENPKGYETASIQNAALFKSKTRFLVMHGSGDDNVHFQNSLRLVDNFNLASVENFDFMVFPDSDHLIRYHNGNTVVYDRILDWLRRAFGNEFKPRAVDHSEL